MTSSATSPDPTFNAIILAGGTSRRLNGTDKANLVFQGRTLLDHVVAAVDRATNLVIVAPRRPIASERPVTWILEDPPSGGPVAGIAAGLGALPLPLSESETVMVLACDLPQVSSAIPILLTALVDNLDVDAAVGKDPMGYRQPLVACYRRKALTLAIAAVPTVRNISLRQVLRHLKICEVELPPQASADIDTWQDAASIGLQITEKQTTDWSHHD